MPEPTAIVTEALKRFTLAVEAEKDQRAREIDDLKFQIPEPEYQWSHDARLARGPATVEGITIPGRPMMCIPKLDQPIQLVQNQERAAHLGVQVDPLSEDADDDTAEVIQDLYRRIERDSRANLARSWAFDRAVKCGRGAYRVNTKYCDDGGHPFDQVITIERILHQSAVYFDPFAEEPDWSDGEWAFEINWLPYDRYCRLYGESALAKGGTSEFEALVDEAPEWAKTDGDGNDAARSVMVAHYWYVKTTKRYQVVLDDDSVGYEDKVPDGRSIKYGKDGTTAEQRKEECSRTVHCCLINGIEEIDSWEWNGKYIPLIPVIGKELQPFDNQRRWVGIIGPAKDSQRMFNYAASNAIELAALEPKTGKVLWEGQEEGHEQELAQMAVRNLAFVRLKPTTLNGELLPLPPQWTTDTSKLQMSMMLVNEADKYIQAATSTFDPSLGRLPSKDRSGKAILALQEQSDAGNSHYLHNLASISMTYEAKVVIDLMASIYDRPGRVARLLDFEDNASTVILNAPFTKDEKGRPHPANGNGAYPPPQPGQTTSQAQPDVKHYDLRKGVYGVSVSIGKSWQTRLQQGGEEIGQILQGSPELMPLIGPTYFKFRDFPGSKEIAELLKKMRAKQFPGLDAEEGEQPNAEQLQAQLQAMQGQMQQMQQQLQQAGQIIQTEQVKQQAQVEIARGKAEADVALKQVEATLKERLEQMKIDAEYALQQLKGQQQLTLQNDQQAHETGMAGADTAAEKDLAQFGAQAAERQAVTQAALEPEPSNNGSGE